MKISPEIRLIVLCTMLLSLMLADYGFAELYKYKDSEGVVHYTDDLGNVPEKYRQDINTMEEIKSLPAESETDKESESGKQKATKEKGSDQLPGDAKKEDQLSKKAEDLSARQAELREEYSQLKDEREKLMNSPPDRSASSEEKARYSQKVENLNKRIEAYSRKVEKFEKELEKFNSRAAEN